MKNKNIISGVLFVFMLLGISSCSDFLDLSPVSSYNSGSFYKTQKDFELAVTGVYDILQYLNNDLIPNNLESRSDNVRNDVIATYGHNLVHRCMDDATTSTLKDIWKRYWIVIDRCNAIIDQIDTGTFTDETRRSNLKGEAYFFRGYAYFQLGWMYGGVQLIDHQMKVDEIKLTARSSQTETFTQAANDLTQAIQLLPEVWPTKELGKATKYAAQGIQARMYMFQKNYSAAKPLLQSIISSGKYQLATSYANCFLDKYDNSTEHVFQVQYKSGNLGEGNGFVAYEVPQFYRSALFPLGGISGAMIASPDLYNAYENSDLRRDFNIQKGYTNSSGQVDTETLYFIKYGHGTIPTTSITDYEVNMPILRYTDVKLMYAEVLNEGGYTSTGEAFSILNEVRSRAGLSPLTSVQVPTQEAFRMAMLKERRVEFANEYLRWFDLLRTGKALSVMNTFFARADEGSGAYKMEEFRFIFPIPQDELKINPDTKYMWQNPGY